MKRLALIAAAIAIATPAMAQNQWPYPPNSTHPGNVNNNPHDPNNGSNGSYSANSTNPYGTCGSSYSPNCVNNPSAR